MSELRARLIVAATRFANEIADAIEEASRERAAPVVRAKKPGRRAGVRAPVADTPVSPEAQARADAALERAGFTRRAR